MRASSEIALLAVLGAGCAAETSREPAVDASRAHAGRGEAAGCRVFVADALIEHSCFHALAGPFRDFDLEARGAGTALDVSRAHTAFRLRLAPDDAGRFRAGLRYHARADAGYAMFLSVPSSLSVAAVGGAALDPFLAHDTELCPELPDVLGYDLHEGDYEISLSSEHEDVTLVIESMDEGTVEDGYRLECDQDPSPQAPAILDAGAADMRDDAEAQEADAQDDAEPNEYPDASAQAADAAVLPAPVDGEVSCTIDPVLEHSCLHVTHGPFAEVMAAGSSGAVANVNRPHTAYQVALPAGEPGRLSFRPNASAEFVFYLGDERMLEVTQAGNPLSPSHVEPVADCSGLSRAWIFSLDQAEQYQLRLETAAEAATLLIIENVEALAIDGWELRHEACPL